MADGPKHDAVDHPAHYTSFPARCGCGRGIECIQITEHMNFCRGNAVKYIWRAGSKGSEIEDLRKARWYLDREISRLSAEALRASAARADVSPIERTLRHGDAIRGRDAQADGDLVAWGRGDRRGAFRGYDADHMANGS